MSLRTKLGIAVLAVLPSVGMAAEEATSFKDALLGGKVRPIAHTA